MSRGAPTVLLTGSRGFTGVHLRKILVNAGYKVVGLVREPPDQEEISADLSDPGSLARALVEVYPDFVIHLAGVAFVAHNDPLDFYKTNLIGTLNLLQAVSDTNLQVRKIILASSSNIYGLTGGTTVTEDSSPAPVNHYAMSKLAMEYMANTWLDHMPIVIVRPFNYTGPGQSEKFVIPKIVAHFERKESKLLLGNLNIKREFNDVRSVAYVYCRLLECGTAGDVVNICTGHGHNLLDVLRLLEELTDHHPVVEVDPGLVRPNELPVLVGDPTRLLSLVPDFPLFTLKDTLRIMIEHFRSQRSI